MSQQLPTLALMKDGECVEIRPEVTSGGKLRKFHFSEGFVLYNNAYTVRLLNSNKNFVMS